MAIIVEMVFPFSILVVANVAGMVELVDTQDLKSCDLTVVRVRFPLLVHRLCC